MTFYHWKKPFVAVLLLLLLSGGGVEARGRRQSFPHQSQQPTEPDYYKVLGVPKTASAKQIKSKFRKLALKYHPDKVSEDQRPEAETKMAQINEAYDVLGDDEKRKIYDQFGKNGLDAHEKGHDPRASGFGGGDPFGGGGFGGGGFGGGGFGGGGFGGGGSNFHFQQTGGGGFGGGGAGGFEDIFKMFTGGAGGGFGGGGAGGFGGGFGGGGGPGGRPNAPPPDLFPKGESKVAKLGKPKFPNKTSKNLWLIMFYNPSDPASQSMAKIYEKLASKAHLAYKVGAVDCSSSSSSANQASFCQSKNVDLQNLPQIAFVANGKLSFYSDDVEDDNISLKALNDFCMKQIVPLDLIQNINHMAQVEERLIGKNNNKPALLLLTDKYETSGMYYSLAYHFRNDFIFGESRAKNLKLAQAFGVKKYPQLVALLPKNSYSSRKEGLEPLNDQYGILRYTGEPKKEDITKWLEGLTPPSSSSSSSQQRKSRR